MSDTPADIAEQIIAGSKTCLECGHTRHDLQALCVVVVDKGAGPQYCSCKSEESQDQYFTRAIAAELDRKDERIRELEQANKELLEALESLPLDAFDKPMEEMDAADFVDNSAAFIDAMELARAALSKHGGTK